MESMATAEDKSWEYTLGRIDERFDHVGQRIEQRLERIEFYIKDIREKMLTKATFFTFTSIVAGLLAAMIALK